jgi:hypothetical protein
MKTPMTRFTLGRGSQRVWLAQLAALLALLTTVSAASARVWSADRTAGGSLVDVQLLVKGGTAALYTRPGAWNRWYFEAFRGRGYAIRVRNTTGERIGVLIAVDGLNVVNGERSRLSGGEPMYVLDPWETATIHGWRSSLSDVRKFVFVDEERSYASRTDQANGDMGWLRVLAFRENRPWPEARFKLNERDARGSVDRGRAGAQAPSAPQGADKAGRVEIEKSAPRDMARMAPETQESTPGTGWGEQRYDPVQRVWFQPEGSARDHLVFRYEYESGLRALGIHPRQRDRVWERERGELGFAQPPRH